MSGSKGCNIISLVTDMIQNLLRHNLVGEMRIKRPNSLFHDLTVRFDRIAARPITIFVRDLYIAYVSSANERAFISSVIHKAPTCTFTVSEVQPKSTYWVSFSNNGHINNFVSVLILRDLDVFWVSFLCAIFLMIRDFSTSTHLPCDRRAALPPCMITSV